MDDVIRLEYQRWSGAQGYTADEFTQTVSDAAGVDVKPLLHKLIATTEEVDYTEMLDWFGLRFMHGLRRSDEDVDARSAAGRDGRDRRTTSRRSWRRTRSKDGYWPPLRGPLAFGLTRPP